MVKIQIAYHAEQDEATCRANTEKISFFGKAGKKPRCKKDYKINQNILKVIIHVYIDPPCS